MPQAAPPIPPAQFAALLYGKAIPVGLASRATWGGRIIEGPVFTVIDNEMTASWISAFFLPMNYWSATRTVTEVLFDGKLAWSLAGGSLLPSGLNVGGATASTEQRIRFNTGLLSQMPDAWSVARFGADAVAHIPLVTATLQNIRLKQFGADNPIPFVSVTVDDTQFAAPGDLVPWQDALETLARYDGRSSAEFATVDVTDGIEVPFILGNDLTLPTLLAGLRKIKPQWSVLTKDKLYLVEKGASTLDLTLQRAKVLKRGDDPITLHQADALARPREEDYTFIDLDRDFEPSMVRCVEDLEPVISTGSVDVQTIDLPFATTANVVQAMANYAYYSREVARESSEWSGRGDYLGIEPGDTYLISPDEMPVAAQHYHRVNEIVRKVDLTVDVKGEAFLTCGVPLSWVDTYTMALTTNTTGWEGANLRQVIGPAYFTSSGTKVRVTLNAGYYLGAGFVIDHAAIGHAALSGDPYDFDGGQIPLTFGGSAGCTVAGWGTVLSDEMTFNFDRTKPFIVAVHFAPTGHSQVMAGSLAPQLQAYSKTAADESVVSDVSAYGASSFMALVSLIEVTG
jgi:Putative phage tail protein